MDSYVYDIYFLSMNITIFKLMEFFYTLFILFCQISIFIEFISYYKKNILFNIYYIKV